MSSSDKALQIAVLLPEVLGTYGDTGNAVVLKNRAKWRGFDAEIISVPYGSVLPVECDIYTLGGGEDVAQALAVKHLSNGEALKTIVDRGSPILAICASLQVLGHWYEDAQGNHNEGLGVLDCHTIPQGFRSIGELVTKPLVEGLTDLLTGFENHGGATILGPDARPLGEVLAGSGNGSVDGKPLGVEGVVQGSVIATYMHGPALARNPQLADQILSKALGESLEPLDIPEVEALRKERLGVALRGNH